MDDTVEVTLSTGEIRQVPFGIRLSEVLGGSGVDAPLAAIMNGTTVELSTRLTDPATVTPLYLSDRSGYAVYARSMCFLLALAVHRALPDAQVTIQHAINNEICGAIRAERPVTGARLAVVADEMRALVARDEPIEKVKVKREEALRIFGEVGADDKLTVITHANRQYLSLYRCLGYYDYLYGALVPSTGHLHTFELVPFGEGFLILLPDKAKPHAVSGIIPMPKLRAAFAETEEWARILKAGSVGDINDKIALDQGRDVIFVSEGLHEKKISLIADAIVANLAHTRLVLVAGPSSSGKTTFSKRLSIQLRVLGFEPFPISADDYFNDREHTPLDAEGHYDFEALEALDVATLNRDLKHLLDGGEIDLVRFNFVTAQRELIGQRYRMNDHSILIVEGIHGLNDAMTPEIPVGQKYRIYASALCPLNMDNHTSIYVSDVRTLRRIVRDNRTRGADAERTLLMWPSVRKGEERNIFPFQENADVMFNSSLLYELHVLKRHAQPLLERVHLDSPVYGEAMRLLEFLTFFKSADERWIAPNSVMREFVGGSCFE